MLWPTLRAQIRRAALYVQSSPWLTTVLMVLTACLIIRPWGDFGLNDDWTFAHFAKTFADTGKLRLDAPTNPSSLGQAILGGLLIRWFGFSHQALRMLSIVVGCAGLFAVDKLIAHFTPRRSIRLMGLLLLAFNPIYFYSMTTFMTEIHGWVPALYSVVLWFWDRRRHETDPNRLLSFPVAMGVGLLSGATFWNRQLCVLVYPAMLGSTVICALARRRFLALARSIPAMLAATLIYGAIIGSFFPWARSTGNFRPEFASRIAQLWTVDGDTYRMQVGSALVYITAFFLPLLALAGWKSKPRWALEIGGVAFVIVGVVAKNLFEQRGAPETSLGLTWHHKLFPFVMNIVYNTGLGPITTDDAFLHEVPGPSWPRVVWVGLELVFIAASALWASVCAVMIRRVRSRRSETSVEVMLFGCLLVLGSLVVTIQGVQQEMVDRYYMPLILGVAIMLPGVLSWVLPNPLGTNVVAKFALLFGGIALFSVLGAHDEFRWGDARLKLIKVALEKGGTPATIQAGYEYNCWNHYEKLADPSTCEGGCRCAQSVFCCMDDRWQVGMSLTPGYKMVTSIQPSYWLASGPPVVLAHRIDR
jgi:hypothetical protein